MSQDFTIIVGTVGDGIWRSTDGGTSFGRARKPDDSPLNSVDTIVKGLGVDPFDPRHVIAGMGQNATPYSPIVGSTHAMWETYDGGATWSPIENFPVTEVWRIVWDTTTPGRYFVGTRPAAIHRTEDGGKTFERLPMQAEEFCRGIGITRITSITLQPDDPSTMLVTVEIGGVRVSFDRGDSWEQVMTDIASPPPNGAVFGVDGRMDCHYSRIIPGRGGDPDLYLVSTPDGLYSSEDRGKSWADWPVEQVFPAQYHRDIAVKIDDPDTIFVGVGDHTAGQEGAIVITRDRGKSWEVAELPDECNSPVWAFGLHASNPEVIVAATHQGMVFGSEDGGHTWEKYRREFTEIRQLCWLPN